MANEMNTQAKANEGKREISVGVSPNTKKYCAENPYAKALVQAAVNDVVKIYKAFIEDNVPADAIKISVDEVYQKGANGKEKMTRNDGSPVYRVRANVYLPKDENQPYFVGDKHTVEWVSINFKENSTERTFKEQNANASVSLSNMTATQQIEDKKTRFKNDFTISALDISDNAYLSENTKLIADSFLKNFGKEVGFDMNNPLIQDRKKLSAMLEETKVKPVFVKGYEKKDGTKTSDKIELYDTSDPQRKKDFYCVQLSYYNDKKIGATRPSVSYSYVGDRSFNNGKPVYKNAYSRNNLIANESQFREIADTLSPALQAAIVTFKGDAERENWQCRESVMENFNQTIEAVKAANEAEKAPAPVRFEIDF